MKGVTFLFNTCCHICCIDRERAIERWPLSLHFLVLLSYKLDFEIRSETARGRLLASESFKMCPLHFLRIATSVAISRERKCPPQSASPGDIHLHTFVVSTG
jgi:hypothetical protein